MARSMAWPPTVVNGRTKELLGADALLQVAQTACSDLSTCPTLAQGLYLRDPSWRTAQAKVTAVSAVLARLSSTARSVTVTPVSATEVDVVIIDDDGSAKGVRL